MSQFQVVQTPQSSNYNDLQQQLQQEEIALQRMDSEDERADRRKMRQLFNQVR